MTRPLPACAGHLTGSKCSGKEIMESPGKWFKLVHADNFGKGIRFFTYICSLRSKKISTTKRLWGYVRTTHVPSHTTLSVLSRLAGYRNWDDFCQSMEVRSDTDSSGFLANRPIEASELQEGDIIDLEWDPDRCCRIVCTGDAQFRVLSQRNSKLCPGDTFHTTQFCPGLPLCITDLRRNDEPPRCYVAGKRKGHGKRHSSLLKSRSRNRLSVRSGSGLHRFSSRLPAPGSRCAKGRRHSRPPDRTRTCSRLSGPCRNS